MSEVLMVMPTFNEAENVERSIQALLAETSVDVLIVDDSSPDGTMQRVKMLQEKVPRAHLLVRPHKEGLGGAYIAGFNWALENNYSIIGEMDADGSHQASDLKRMLEALKDADIILGSRWNGGKVKNWPWRRLALSRTGNIYVRLMLGTSVKDATGGYRLYKKEALKETRFNSIKTQGYGFQVEILKRALEAKLKVREVPITFIERQYGHSKMNTSIILEAFLQVTRWGFTRFKRKLQRQRLLPPRSTQGE